MNSGSGSGGGGAGGGSSPVVMTSGGSAAVKPKGLLDAIGEIEQFFVLESNGGDIPERFLSTKARIEFFEVGFKGSFVSGMISALLTPLAISVIEKKLPIFGDETPSLFDKIFVLALALGFSFGYAVFIGAMGKYYRGDFTKSVIRSFLGGVIVGGISKVMVSFILFHFIAFTMMTDGNAAKTARWLYTMMPKKQEYYDFAISVYQFLVTSRTTMVTSAWVVVLTTIVFLSVPIVSIAWALRKERIEHLQ